ncbi:LuxR C-terminal-related transcriptional regulator [Knoellia sp. CPCC 206450]|uniref:helix-turn-helix transcriptional regulator n=1 Tax=Knoellia tibetensis TaxID=3404798 RepID=UPI003B432EC9
MSDPAVRLAIDELTTRVYLLLLRHPSPRRSALLREGLTESEIAAALANLEARGMVNASRADLIEVFPPDTTLPAWAADLERQARTTRSAVEGLTHMYNEARAGAGGTTSNRDVSILDTVEEVEAAYFRLARRAENRCVRLFARSRRMDELVISHPESIAIAHRSSASPGLQRQVVFEQSILEVRGAFAALEAMRADGIDVRLTPHLAFSVLAVDRTSALVDISHLDSGGGSLQVQQRELASALMDMCLGLFALATPLPRTPRSVSVARLTERDGQIMALLAAGASDLTMARQLDISQRTVERRVRAIMVELGATTRFQAGAIAGRRGLI